MFKMGVFRKHLMYFKLAQDRKTGEVRERYARLVTVAESEKPSLGKTLGRNVFDIQEAFPGCFKDAFHELTRLRKRCSGEEPRRGLIEDVVCGYPGAHLAKRARTDLRYGWRSLASTNQPHVSTKSRSAAI